MENVAKYPQNGTDEKFLFSYLTDKQRFRKIRTFSFLPIYSPPLIHISMKKPILLLLTLCCISLLHAGEVELSGPHRRLTVVVSDSGGARPSYPQTPAPRHDLSLDASPLRTHYRRGRLHPATRAWAIPPDFACGRSTTYSLRNSKRSERTDRYLAHTREMPFLCRTGKRASR